MSRSRQYFRSSSGLHMPLGIAIHAAPLGQCKLKRSLTSCPEMIFANDNLVGGATGAGLLLATTIAGADGDWLDAP